MAIQMGLNAIIHETEEKNKKQKNIRFHSYVMERPMQPPYP